jgi:hypothetical protein
MGPWTWWSQITRALRHHTGDMNGMPFQISTRPSQGPSRPVSSASAERGNTV